MSVHTDAGIVAGNRAVPKGERTHVIDGGTVVVVGAGDLAGIFLAIGNGKINALVHDENERVMNRIVPRPGNGLSVQTKVDVGCVRGNKPSIVKRHIFC